MKIDNFQRTMFSLITLKEIAMTGGTLTYSGLGSEVGMGRRSYGAALDGVYNACVALGLPDLTALVVYKHNGRVGPGFFGTEEQAEYAREQCYRWATGRSFVAADADRYQAA